MQADKMKVKSNPEKVMGHTEGKLEYRKNPWDDGKYDLRSIEKGALAYAPLAHVKGDKRVTGGNGEANARRLVACWNEHDGLVHDNAQLYQSLQGEMKGRLEAEAERDELVKALEAVTALASRGICEHEETHRGGAIWEICDSCGAKWADDEGGKPVWVEPSELTNAYAILAHHQENKEA